MKIPRTSARDQGYAGPAERHMADRRCKNEQEIQAEDKQRVSDELDRQREERWYQKALNDMEIAQRDFRIIENSLEKKLKKAEDALAEKEASLKAMEVAMDKLNEELTRSSGSKAEAGPSTEKGITGDVLLSLNSQWRARWNHLVDKQKEAKRRGEEPEDMFLPIRP